MLHCIGELLGTDGGYTLRLVQWVSIRPTLLATWVLLSGGKRRKHAVRRRIVPAQRVVLEMINIHSESFSDSSKLGLQASLVKHVPINLLRKQQILAERSTIGLLHLAWHVWG